MFYRRKTVQGNDAAYTCHTEKWIVKKEFVVVFFVFFISDKDAYETDYGCCGSDDEFYYIDFIHRCFFYRYVFVGVFGGYILLNTFLCRYIHP